MAEPYIMSGLVTGLDRSMDSTTYTLNCLDIALDLIPSPLDKEWFSLANRIGITILTFVFYEKSEYILN